MFPSHRPALLRVLPRYRSLDRQRSQQIVPIAKAGNMGAQLEVLGSVGALIVHEARKWARTPDQLDDLSQEGVIGALNAIERFDPAYDVKFATYAKWWICNSIQRAQGVRTPQKVLPLDVPMPAYLHG